MNRNETIYRERLFRKLNGVFSRGRQVLDAGCGEGAVAEMLAERGCQVTGVDVEPHPEAWARRGERGICFQEGSAEKLQFKDASFDVVWAQDALHHMAHPEQALREFWRVVKPGGKIVIVEANRFNPVFYLHMTLIQGHEHFSRSRFRKLLATLPAKPRLQMAESRCLPWANPLLLSVFGLACDLLEAVKVFNPWLTYQIAVVEKKS